jgi:2-polyprenyl-3-methyl-5-hydroxy-6-metoxy-1,4-benzoquinol methylase
VIKKSQIKKSESYYAALGAIKWALDYKDIYRLKRATKNLIGRSVLDAGCGKADFLKLIEGRYQIGGIEVNEERADYCNQVLGQDAVKVGNLNEKLDCGDSSFDTVVCLEVIEHLEDPASALKEMIRVSRRRVIITVPFNEKIRYVLCMHCGKRTSASDHLHSFNEENIVGIVPDNARLAKVELIGNSALNYLPPLRFVFRLPIFISSIIDRFCNLVLPRASWMMVILDKTSDLK